MHSFVLCCWLNNRTKTWLRWANNVLTQISFYTVNSLYPKLIWLSVCALYPTRMNCTITIPCPGLGCVFPGGVYTRSALADDTTNATTVFPLGSKCVLKPSRVTANRIYLTVGAFVPYRELSINKARFSNFWRDVVDFKITCPNSYVPNFSMFHDAMYFLALSPMTKHPDKHTLTECV